MTRKTKMRALFLLLWMLLCSITSASAQVSVGIGLPGVSIGINLPVYPQLVAVPGYPVYYAPQMNSNYFFYDGLYWVYQRDNWYASSWYNGPWGLVSREAVPLFVLRVPVRYYRQPPAYFHGWRSDAPPRWDEHWGNTWAQNHGGWDNWNRSSVPAPAPLPAYQRQYSGNRYPRAEQQQVLQTQNYRYQPQEAVVQQHYQAQRVQSPQTAPAPAPQARQAAPQERIAPQQEQRATGRPTSPQQVAPPAHQQAAPPAHQQAAPPVHQQAAPPVRQPAGSSPPRAEPQQRGGGNAQKPVTSQAPPKQGGSADQRQEKQQPQQGAAQHGQNAPRSKGQDQGPQGKGPAQEPKQGKGKEQEKGEPQGGERGK